MRTIFQLPAVGCAGAFARASRRNWRFLGGFLHVFIDETRPRQSRLNYPGRDAGWRRLPNIILGAVTLQMKVLRGSRLSHRGRETLWSSWPQHDNGSARSRLSEDPFPIPHPISSPAHCPVPDILFLPKMPAMYRSTRARDGDGRCAGAARAKRTEDDISTGHQPYTPALTRIRTFDLNCS
ncbi:hypothetical protein EVAR_965_1 [Eumeta japonica]|uniref:Uncharacterized protein n=1 Tax=Eumeta variegata TaxID=151549 RepID=A0A4C1SGV5_EUMVA|nr:hypothetical protein EVAR_965_1 [Eumeta japonica]